MARTVKAKWGINKEQPEDIPDFLSNDEIAEKMGGHPRGTFRMKIKGVPTVVANSSGDDMIKMVLEINDPRKEKAGFNGYACWENQNITDVGKPYLLKWLRGLGVTWEQFLAADMIPATKLDPAQLAKIGPVNFAGKSAVYVEAVLGKDNRPERDNSRVVRWIPAEDASAGEEEVEEEVEPDEDVEVEGEEDIETGDTSEEEAELREELEGLTLAVLKKRIKENCAELEETPPKMVGKDKAWLIDFIVNQEVEPEGDEDEEDEADEEDEEAELREELSDTSAWTLAKLKARCKDNGHKLLELKKITDRDALIDMIIADEVGAEDEDDNEPPF